MEDLELLEPTDLYNLLQQATVYSSLSDSNYLMLIDCRKKAEYNESHVITSKKCPKTVEGDYAVPYDAELECKQNIVVYDSNTSSLRDNGDAIECAQLLWELGTRCPVKVLKGGYEAFSALYPFLRTQKILYMPREMDDHKPYPSEILPGFLYLGNWRQGNASDVQKDIKIKGHINCCIEEEIFFPDPGPHLLHLQVEDIVEADLYSKFKNACTFLDMYKAHQKACLVFSYLGISRSATVVIAYLIHSRRVTLKEAYEHVLRCCSNIRPNRGFVEQLSRWEEEVLGTKSTDISDPNF